MNFYAALPLLLVLVLLGTHPARAASQPSTHAMSETSRPLSPKELKERKAVEELMADLARLWSLRDMPGYLAHFAEDADLVNRAGTWLQGRASIEKQLLWLAQVGRPELFTLKVSTQAIRSVSPGVVTVIQRRDEGVRESLATYVLALHGDAWKVHSLSIAPVEPVPTR